MNGLVACCVGDRGKVPAEMQFATDCRLSSPGWDAKSSEIGSSIGNPGSSDSPPLLY